MSKPPLFITKTESMSEEKINKAALEYSSQIDFSDDRILNEKGRLKIIEWAIADFIAGVK